MTTAARAALHHLIEDLPESDLHTVQAFVEFLHNRARAGADAIDIARQSSEPAQISSPGGEAVEDRDHGPFREFINGPIRDHPAVRALIEAPEDDEELTPDDAAALDQAMARHRNGTESYTAHKDLVRELGE